MVLNQKALPELQFLQKGMTKRLKIKNIRCHTTHIVKKIPGPITTIPEFKKTNREEYMHCLTANNSVLTRVSENIEIHQKYLLQWVICLSVGLVSESP